MKLVFALLGVALVAGSSWPQERLFSSQQEYRFRYEASLASGIALPDTEAALTRVRYDVVLQMFDEKIAAFQLQNIEMAQDNVKVPESQEFVPFDELEQQELTSAHKKEMESPVRFRIEDGIISDLSFADEDSVWSRNVKRSVINMLQLNIEKLSSGDESSSQNRFFSDMEQTVEGECEVDYNVVEEPEMTWVTKSINFDNCTRRMEWTYNYRFTSECPECEKTRKIVPQTLYSYKIEKEQLKEVELKSVYSVSLKDDSLIRTTVRARLSFTETSSIRDEIQAPRQDKEEEIIYDMKFDHAVEDFLKKGDRAKLNPMSAIPKKIETIKDIIDKLALQKGESSESADYFMRLVQYIRTCSMDELRDVHSLYEKTEKRVQDIIEHSLAVSGSKNTINHLFTHASSISVPRMVMLLKSIQETPFPSDDIIEDLLRFIRSEKCRNEPVLLQAAWLAYGTMVRGIVGPTVEKHAVSPKSELFKDDALTVMKNELRRSEEVYKKILLIKAIANSGIDTAVTVLEPIINKKTEHTTVRMEAIDALRHLAEYMPRKIHRLLMPVYSNRLEKNEIRMAALKMLLQAKPARDDLSHIVMRMEREPNQHIAAFTYHMLSSLADSALPGHRNISVLATNLLRNSLYRPEPRLLSMASHWSYFCEESLSGLGLQLEALIGKDSLIPKDMSMALDSVFGGNWNQKIAQIGFSHQNVEALFNKVISRLSKWAKKESRASRYTASKIITVLKKLDKELNIRVRESNREEPFAMVYLRYKQMDYAVLPINEQYLDRLIEEFLQNGSIDFKRIERLFTNDMEPDFVAAGFVIDSMMKISNSLGLPMVFYNKMPTVFRFNGTIRMERTSSGYNTRVQVQPQLSLLYFHSMHVWVPSFTNGFKNIRTAEIHIPIDFEFKINLGKKTEIQFKTHMPKEEKTLIRLGSRPACFVRYFSSDKDIFYSYKEETVRVPSFERMVKEITKKIEVQGVEFVLSASSYENWNLQTLLLGEQQLELTMAPTSEMEKETIFKLTSDTMEIGRIEEPDMEKMLGEQMDTETGEWEINSRKERREHLMENIKNLEIEKAYKHRIQMEILGQKSSKMEVRVECEGELRHCRFVAESKSDGPRGEYRIESQFLLPKYVSSMEQLKQQKHREIQIQAEIMWEGEQRNTIKIVGQVEQSAALRSLLKKKTGLRGIPEQDQLTQLARLNQIRIKADYKLSRENQRHFENVFNVIKARSYWTSEIEMVDNENNQVFIKMTTEPINRQLWNVTIETPETSFVTKGVRNYYLGAVLPSIVRQSKNSIRHSEWEKSECKIDNNRVHSFDGSVFRAPMSDCYTVIAKDCSAEPRYAVLVKSQKRNSLEKMVKVIFEEEEMELEVVDEKLKVNGRVVRDSDFEEKRIEKVGEVYVIDLDDIVVRFDGILVKVLLSKGQMETQCGICGHFDGEKGNDYRTAKNEETSDIEDFYRSYIVQGEDCDLAPSFVKHYYEYEEEESNEDDYNDWPRMEKKYRKKSSPLRKSSEESDRSREIIEPEEKIVVDEQSHKICFSLEPVLQCPKGARMEKKAEKKVRFGCIRRHSSEARRLIAAIRQGKTPETSQLKFSYLSNQAVPRTCIEA